LIVQEALFMRSSPRRTWKAGFTLIELLVSLEEPYNDQFGSAHGGIAHFVFGDGSVWALRTSISGSTLGLPANRADGMPIAEDS
jgi:hypothetical protein